MYSVVLAAMLTTGGAMPAWGCYGCYGGCYGGGNAFSCYGGCYGCHGCYGCYGNAFSCFGCSGCSGCSGCYGCYGGYAVVSFGCLGSGSCYGWGGCYGYSGYMAGSYYSNCYGCYGTASCYGCYGSSACYGCTGCSGCYGGSVVVTSPVMTYSSPVIPGGTVAPPVVNTDEPKRISPPEGGNVSATPLQATLVVTLPADAQLYVDGDYCPLTSSTRTFNTPMLDPGRRYSYTLKVELVREGKRQTQTRQVVFEAGKRVVVGFQEPAQVQAAKR